MPIVFQGATNKSCCGRGSPFVSVLTCCPCTLPFSGTRDPDNFCTEFPNGTGSPCPPCPGIAPFVVALNTPATSLSDGPGGRGIVLSYDGSGVGGTLLLLGVPGPLINPTTDAFCF